MKKKTILLSIGSFLAVLLVSMHLVYAQGGGITITESTNQVNQTGEKILFQTDVPVTENEKPIVFIKDPLNQWWPWLQTMPLSNDRIKWELKNVQFGIASDHGQMFQIQILLLNNSDINNGIQIQAKTIDIEAGTALKNSTFRKLRDRLQIKSDIITVKRK